MSVFNSILSIKQKLKDSIEKQDQQLLALTNGFADQISSYDFKDIVLNGEVSTMLSDTAYQLTTQLNSPGLTITKIGLDPSTGEELAPVTLNIVDVSAVDANEYISSLGCSINDIAAQVSYGLNTNTLVASVNDLFLNGDRVATSDIYTTMESIPAIESTDVNQFRTMIAQASDGGYVHQVSWLQVLKEICKVGSDATDSGHIALDSDSPFRLQSFMATVVSVLTIAFNAVVTAVGFLLNGVIAVIGLVVGAIVQGLSSLAPTTISIDQENLGNEYVKGDFGANNITSINDFSDASVTFHSDSTNRIKLGCFETFIWRNSSTDTKLNMQQFLNLSVDLNKLCTNLKSLINNGKIVISKTAYTAYSLYDIDLSRLTSNELLEALNDTDPSVDDCLQLHFDTNKLLSNYFFGAAAHSLLWLKASNYQLSSADHGISPNYTPMNYKEVFIFLGLTLIRFAYEDIDPYSYSIDTDSLLFSKFTDWLIQYRENFSSFSTSTHASSLSSTLYTTGGSSGIPEVKCGFTGYYYDGVVTNWADTSALYGLISYRNHRYFLPTGEEWDGLIPKPTVTLPSVTSSQLILACLTTIALVTAACLITKSIVRKIRSWKQVNAAKRQNALSTLKGQWLADPGNADKRKAYQNAITTYNKKASLFGWAKYDAQNDWMESSGSGSAASLSNAASSLRTNLMTLDSEVSLSDIYKVITSGYSPAD